MSIFAIALAGDEEGRAESVVDVGRVDVATTNILQGGAIFPQLKREVGRSNGLWAKTTSNGSQIELGLEDSSVEIVTGVEGQDIVDPFARTEKRNDTRRRP
jgi:hypothetical protein